MSTLVPTHLHLYTSATPHWVTIIRTTANKFCLYPGVSCQDYRGGKKLPLLLHLCPASLIKDDQRFPNRYIGCGVVCKLLMMWFLPLINRTILKFPLEIRRRSGDDNQQFKPRLNAGGCFLFLHSSHCWIFQQEKPNLNSRRRQQVPVPPLFRRSAAARFTSWRHRATQRVKFTRRGARWQANARTHIHARTHAHETNT